MAKYGGSNFKIKKLVNINSERIEFRPTLGAIFFLFLLQ